MFAGLFESVEKIVVAGFGPGQFREQGFAGPGIRYGAGEVGDLFFNSGNLLFNAFGWTFLSCRLNGSYHRVEEILDVIGVEDDVDEAIQDLFVQQLGGDAAKLAGAVQAGLATVAVVIAVGDFAGRVGVAGEQGAAMLAIEQSGKQIRGIPPAGMQMRHRAPVVLAQKTLVDGLNAFPGFAIHDGRHIIFDDGGFVATAEMQLAKINAVAKDAGVGGPVGEKARLAVDLLNVGAGGFHLEGFAH